MESTLINLIDLSTSIIVCDSNKPSEQNESFEALIPEILEEFLDIIFGANSILTRELFEEQVV